MPTHFIGEIRMFGGHFAPVGWEFCHGQDVAIEEHGDLFRLIGTTYGGDGAKTFALPDLKRRSPMHRGRGFYNRREYPIGAVTAVDGAAATTDPSATGDDAPWPAVPGRLSLNFIIATGGVYPSREWGAAVGEKDLNSVDYVYKPGERVPPVSAADVVSPEQREGEPSPPNFGVNFMVALEGIYPQRP